MSSMSGLIISRVAQANATTSNPKPGDRCLVRNEIVAPDLRQNISTIHRSHTCSTPDRCDTCGAEGQALVQLCTQSAA
jgi:hypothetical protein